MSWTDDDDEYPPAAVGSRRAEPARSGSHAAAPSGRRTRGPLIAVLILGLLLVLVVLALLALPFLTVRTEGTQARANLTAALSQMRVGNLPAATQSVQAARADVTAADAAANGFRADVVAALPVGGDAVDDVRNLVSALDQSVAVAEIGIELYPSVLGEDAALVRDGTVDLTGLASVIDATDRVEVHLRDAHESLDAIGAGTPVVGSTIATARDEALEQVVSLEATLQGFRPLLEAMPRLLGTESPTTYLVAVMNPSELRASGGATLSMGEMSIDQGVITFGASGNTTDFTDNNEIVAWPPVADNPWHTGPTEKLVNATFSPNWTTSGEELLRAWEATTGTAPQALIALDVIALAELFRITGPVQVEGYGTLNANNLTESLVGSYDDFRNFEQRKRVNEAVIPVLREKLLEGGKFVQKAQAMVEQAQGRHVVAYFRDPEIQEVIAGLGLIGDLSATTQDYLGVFTQNTNASKVDFWQRRTVASEVTLAADGSADVVTTVTIANDTPPYEQRVADPQRGYFTRYSFPLYVQSLPVGAEVAEMTVDGVAVAPPAFVERGRPVLRHPLQLPPGATATVVVRYRVPQAAVPVDGGGLEYAIDIDPQGTVIPGSYSVLLRLPEGYREAEVEGDWTVNPDLSLLLESVFSVRTHATVTLVAE